jgi:glycosyltransferase involved in cell wall biosynthesis
MNRRIKLCIVSPLFHPDLGGVGRQAVFLTNKLREKGLDLFVISRMMKNTPEFQPPLNIDIFYMPALMPHVHILEEKSFFNLWISLSFSLMLVFKLFRMRKKYNIVHFHGASIPLIICLPLLKLLRKKVIAKVLASRLGTEAGSLKGKYLFVGNVLAWTLRSTDKFIAISQEIADGLKKNGIQPEKIKKITNFADTEKFRPINSQERHILKTALSIDKDIVINFTGRIVERKGVDILVNAFAESMELMPSSILIIVGAGPDEDKIKNMASKLGINNKIRFFGHSREVIKYYHAADIYVLPSYAEGMPNSLLEAMACGLPIIASKIGGVVDVIENGKDGILFEPGDISGLSSALVRLSKDVGLRVRLGEEARKKAVEGFSIERVADEYIKIYENMLIML